MASSVLKCNHRKYLLTIPSGTSTGDVNTYSVPYDGMEQPVAVTIVDRDTGRCFTVGNFWLGVNDGQITLSMQIALVSASAVPRDITVIVEVLI